ncbi:MAG: arginase [Bacteroidetes bacterium HGW-Bacteroidetes-1]|jgi:arginase family enzyme|nr:MAG: arginase [Bacteroidetes bacterium HGW-Bacteroidetes-1]
MEISLFLEPVKLKTEELSFRPGQQPLGEMIRTYSQSGSFPDLDDVRIAIVGIKEERNAVNNMGCSDAPQKVRESLYPLFYHWPAMKIADLGNIRAGHSIDDTYFALNQVVESLISNKIIPIVIGGSQDLTYSLYQAYENIGQLVNIVSVDPIFDIGQEEDEFSAHSYLSKIILHQPNYLFNYTNLGYQTYYVDHKAVDLMKNLLFDVYRLGLIKSKMEQAEPVVRNADILSFDISAIRAADAPGNGNAGPNGFTGDEACRIARYAGFSDKLSSIGFFEYNPSLDKAGITAALIAQMIWYFIDGVAGRAIDLPVKGSEDFARYTVRIDGQEEDVIFLRSKKTDRWWIDLSFGRTDRKKYERHHYVPCSKEDYDQALTDEIPDRWWQFFQKLM